MVSEVVERLKSIDSVFSEEGLEKGKTIDTRREENTCDINKVIELELERKYVLVEITVEQNGESHSEVYLRGFDYCAGFHDVIVRHFLSGDLLSSMRDYFEIPGIMPRKEKGLYRMSELDPEKSFEVENDNGTLTVTVLGGAKYRFKEGELLVYGSSRDYGPVLGRREDENRLFEDLLSRPLFAGRTLSREY